VARHCSAALEEKLPPQRQPQRPLPERLESLSNQETGKKVVAVLSLIAAELRNGSTFTAAIQKQSSRLGLFFCRTAAQGEAAGTLAPLLTFLADFYEKNDLFEKKINRTLRYPAIVLVITIAAIAALLAFFVPAAARSITMYRGTLPAVTKITLAVITFLSVHRQSALIFLLLLLGVPASLRLVNARQPWQSLLETILWAIPVFGNFRRGYSLRRIAAGLSFLSAAGVNYCEALPLTAETVPNASLRHKLLRAAQEKHPSLAAALKAVGIFPPGILGTISNGNEGAQFNKIAEFYEEEVLAAVNAIVLVIEPFIVAIAGLLGVGILLALYLPALRSFFR
jgi:type IV pilus assembly protein PilC